jgi:hypothetical protein
MTPFELVRQRTGVHMNAFRTGRRLEAQLRSAHPDRAVAFVAPSSGRQGLEADPAALLLFQMVTTFLSRDRSARSVAIRSVNSI